jgi:hypothetical protein
LSLSSNSLSFSLTNSTSSISSGSSGSEYFAHFWGSIFKGPIKPNKWKLLTICHYLKFVNKIIIHHSESNTDETPSINTEEKYISTNQHEIFPYDMPLKSPIYLPLRHWLSNLKHSCESNTLTALSINTL